jgi:hypothetical protein
VLPVQLAVKASPVLPVQLAVRASLVKDLYFGALGRPKLILLILLYFTIQQLREKLAHIVQLMEQQAITL